MMCSWYIIYCISICVREFVLMACLQKLCSCILYGNKLIELEKISKPIELLQRYEFHKRLWCGRWELSGTRNVLRSLLTVHRVGHASWPQQYPHKEAMYLHFINVTDFCNTSCIASRSRWRNDLIEYLIIWWYWRKPIKWLNCVT